MWKGRFLGGVRRSPPGALEEELRSPLRERPGDHLLYLPADRDTPYSLVLDAIEAARDGGGTHRGAHGTEIPAQEGDEGRRGTMRRHAHGTAVCSPDQP